MSRKKPPLDQDPGRPLLSQAPAWHTPVIILFVIAILSSALMAWVYSDTNKRIANLEANGTETVVLNGDGLCQDVYKRALEQLDSDLILSKCVPSKDAALTVTYTDRSIENRLRRLENDVYYPASVGVACPKGAASTVGKDLFVCDSVTRKWVKGGASNGIQFFNNVVTSSKDGISYKAETGQNWTTNP